jgi:hypothetical protein
MNCVWTPEMDARLIAGYQDLSLSTRALAAEIGVTIGSLVGRADRLGLNREELIRLWRLELEKRAHNERVLSSAKLCRYITGDPCELFREGSARYCGAAVHNGGSYCPEHRDVIYVPAEFVAADLSWRPVMVARGRVNTLSRLVKNNNGASSAPPS